MTISFVLLSESRSIQVYVHCFKGEQPHPWEDPSRAKRPPPRLATCWGPRGWIQIAETLVPCPVVRLKHRPNYPRRVLGEKVNKDPNPEQSNGHWTALDSDAALNAAWARRVGMISHLPRSAWVHYARPVRSPLFWNRIAPTLWVCGSRQSGCCRKPTRL